MPIINVVGTTCPPEMEERFRKWYDEKHIPELMNYKGLKKVTRYNIVGAAKGVPGVNLLSVKVGGQEYPKFLTIYEFDDLQAFEGYDNSPDMATARKDWFKVKEEIGAEIVWRVQFESVKVWQR